MLALWCTPAHWTGGEVVVCFSPFLGKARELTKKTLRKEFVEALENNRAEDIKDFCDCILDENVQKAIGKQIEKISKKN